MQYSAQNSSVLHRMLSVLPMDKENNR